MTPRARGGPTSGSAPPSLPAGNPTAAPFDHSFTLQGVMDLSKSVAILGEKIDRMSVDVKDMSGKLDAANDRMDKLKHWQTVVTAGAIVVAAIASLVWTVVTFVPWDRIQIAPASAASKK